MDVQQGSNLSCCLYTYVASHSVINNANNVCQYMGIGVHGAVGEPAVEHAMEAKCDVIVPVTIPGQRAVEGPVLELTHRFTAVTPIFAQVS